ncbi:sensor domain-containing diguanylate cyclase [Herminiimonas aquatilis]|uniref:diguanylate cyclase n=1 Tax=Herminiimonas aquatilis TaxID=345342 RepID=A0ABW2J6F7_9BURK
MVHDFASATNAIIQFLRNRFDLDLWMITRTEGNDWIVLAVEESYYDVKAGKVFNWSDSFCSRMVEGVGPRVAPQSDAIEVYRTTPIASRIKIGAYVGVPIMREDGTLFGTLCAIDPHPQPESIREEQKLIEMMADLLSSILHKELAVADATRRAERAEAEAARDGLTALYNRRGWDELLMREEDRCRRYGNPTCVISIDLDALKIINDSQGHSAGDQLIVRAGAAINDVIRLNDIAARVGGDEFSILCVECTPEDAAVLVDRLRRSFEKAAVSASIGVASRHPEKGLIAACEQADANMYAEKRSKQRLLTSDHH